MIQQTTKFPMDHNCTGWKVGIVMLKCTKKVALKIIAYASCESIATIGSFKDQYF